MLPVVWVGACDRWRVAGPAPVGAPAGTAVRPTSDRVREAVFDILFSLGGVEGLQVADLFAGTGAMGIEALSRGAASVTFVDRESGRLAARAGRIWRRWASPMPSGTAMPPSSVPT